MKNKLYLILSIIEIIIGIFGTISFVIVILNNEEISKWITSLILSLFVFFNGIIGIKDYIELQKK